MSTNEPTLKPCPFCGEAPLEDRVEPHEHTTMILGHVPIPYSYPGSWSVECVKCECRIFSHDSREEAVRRWNTRTPDASLQSRLEDDARDAARYRYCQLHGWPVRNQTGNPDKLWIAHNSYSGDLYFGVTPSFAIDAALAAASVDGDKGEGK